jgi:Mn2+/Fe2+ NRAMP family transporter
MLRRIKAIGPGAVVAAAFIGPGTLAVASTSGGNFGYSLLWAVAFSTIACLILQEMSARLGVVAQIGVGEAIRQKFVAPPIKFLSISLVLCAILVGNAAFESGNISGGVLGVKLAAGDSSPAWLQSVAVVLIASVAFGLLWSAKYKVVERSLIGLVAIMGLVFLTTAFLVKPNSSSILSGLFRPQIPSGSLLKVIGLIGTTVVPYNLFLHAAAAKNRWHSSNSLTDARLDTFASIIGGGLITAAIIITAAPIFDSGLSGDSEGISRDLPTIFAATADKIGSWFGWFMALGFLAAGLSSAITAPLAAAFVTAELFGWPKEMSDFRFRLVWISVLLVGMFFALISTSPQQLIVVAQIANGLLLPIIAIFLIWVANDRQLLGEYKNNIVANLLGIGVVIVTVGLGLIGILKALKVFL